MKAWDAVADFVNPPLPETHLGDGNGVLRRRCVLLAALQGLNALLVFVFGILCVAYPSLRVDVPGCEEAGWDNCRGGTGVWVSLLALGASVFAAVVAWAWVERLFLLKVVYLGQLALAFLGVLVLGTSSAWSVEWADRLGSCPSSSFAKLELGIDVVLFLLALVLCILTVIMIVVLREHFVSVRRPRPANLSVIFLDVANSVDNASTPNSAVLRDESVPEEEVGVQMSTFDADRPLPTPQEGGEDVEEGLYDDIVHAMEEADISIYDDVALHRSSQQPSTSRPSLSTTRDHSRFQQLRGDNSAPSADTSSRVVEDEENYVSDTGEFDD